MCFFPKATGSNWWNLPWKNFQVRMVSALLNGIELWGFRQTIVHQLEKTQQSFLRKILALLVVIWVVHVQTVSFSNQEAPWRRSPLFTLSSCSFQITGSFPYSHLNHQSAIQGLTREKLHCQRSIPRQADSIPVYRSHLKGWYTTKSWGHWEV